MVNGSNLGGTAIVNDDVDQQQEAGKATEFGRAQDYKCFAGVIRALRPGLRFLQVQECTSPCTRNHQNNKIEQRAQGIEHLALSFLVRVSQPASLAFQAH